MSAKEKSSAGPRGSEASAPKDSSPSVPGAAKSSPRAGAKRGPVPRQGARQERKAGEPLRNQQHEMFAQLYSVSNNASEAYRKAIGRGENCDVLGPRMLGTLGMRERIAELREQTAARVQKSREDLTSWLADIIDERVAVRPEQLKAAELLNKMCGWNEPEKVEQAMTIRIIE